MSAEPLVFIPVDKWDELKSAFTSDLPRSISGLTVLQTEESILESGCDYGFKVYCPFGNVKNGIVAVNIKHTYYEVIVQCPSDDTKEVEEALRNTKIIDWNKCIEVPYASKHVMDCVLKIFMEKNCKIQQITKTDTYLLDKDTPPFDIRFTISFFDTKTNVCLNALIDSDTAGRILMKFSDIFKNEPADKHEILMLSSDLSFKLLTEEYVQLVDDNWPHKYPGSDWYFNMLTRAKLGYGLFKGKELLTWVFIKEMGALGHLYTLEKHRRKGYGELILKLISNKLLEDNKYVVAFCVTGNSTAASLYTKLGFKCVNELIWCMTDASVSI